MQRRLRVGVIGLGFIGVAHIEALRRLGYVDVVGVSDVVDAEKKAESCYVEHAYSDWKKLIDNENLDAVHICTPNVYHYEMAMYAMERGVAVVLEKPFTMTVDEAEKLVAYAREHHIVTAVNHSLRMNPMVEEMKDLVKQGALGDRIYAISGSYLQDWLLYDTDWSWRLVSSMSGTTRAYSDIGTHWVDMVENITGLKAVELIAESEIVHKTRKKPTGKTETFSSNTSCDYEEIPIDTEDWCSILFRFDNGAIGSLSVSQVTAGRKNQQVIDISGSEASLSWNNENSNELWIGRRNEPNQVIVKDPGLLGASARTLCGYPGGHVEGFPDTFKNNFNEFYHALMEKDDSPRGFANFADGLREMLIAECVYESSKSRTWVRIPEEEIL